MLAQIVILIGRRLHAEQLHQHAAHANRNEETETRTHNQAAADDSASQAGQTMRDVLLLGLAVVSGLAGVGLFVFGARVLIHEAQVAHWRQSLTAFELRLPRTATVAEVSRWVGTVRAMVRARRWWSILPRWPLVVETTATRAGVRRVLLVPARLRSEVISTVAALVPGARLVDLPDYLTTGERVRYQAAA